MKKYLSILIVLVITLLTINVHAEEQKEILIDFSKIEYWDEMSILQEEGINILRDNAIINNNNYTVYYNADGKELFMLDDTSKIIISENVTEEDNITYGISEEALNNLNYPDSIKNFLKNYSTIKVLFNKYDSNRFSVRYFFL